MLRVCTDYSTVGHSPLFLYYKLLIVHLDKKLTSLKIGQNLCTHKPDFLMPGHVYNIYTHTLPVGIPK